MKAVLFLQNTIPMYFIEFRNKFLAQRFGVALKLFGDANNVQYRFKILTQPNEILSNKSYNSFRVEEMSKSLFNEILGEIQNFNMREYYRTVI